MLYLSIGLFIGSALRLLQMIGRRYSRHPSLLAGGLRFAAPVLLLIGGFFLSTSLIGIIQEYSNTYLSIDILRRIVSGVFAGYLFIFIIEYLIDDGTSQLPDPDDSGKKQGSNPTTIADTLHLGFLSVIVIALMTAGALEWRKIEAMFGRISSVNFQGFSLVLTGDKIREGISPHDINSSNIKNFQVGASNLGSSPNKNFDSNQIKNLRRISAITNSIKNDRFIVDESNLRFLKELNLIDEIKNRNLLTWIEKSKNEINMNLDALQDNVTTPVIICLSTISKTEREPAALEPYVSPIANLLRKFVMTPDNQINDLKFKQEITDAMQSLSGYLERYTKYVAPTISESTTTNSPCKFEIKEFEKMSFSEESIKIRPYTAMAAAYAFASIKRYGSAIDILAYWLARHEKAIAGKLSSDDLAESKLELANLPMWRWYRLSARMALTTLLEEWLKTDSAPESMRELLLVSFLQNADDLEHLPGFSADFAKLSREDNKDVSFNAILDAHKERYHQLISPNSCKVSNVSYLEARTIAAYTNQIQLFIYHSLQRANISDYTWSRTTKYIEDIGRINKVCLFAAFQALEKDPDKINSIRVSFDDFLIASMISQINLQVTFDVLRILDHEKFWTEEEKSIKIQNQYKITKIALSIAKNLTTAIESDAPILVKNPHKNSDSEIYDENNMSKYYTWSDTAGDDIEHLEIIVRLLEQ